MINKSHWYDGWFYDFFISPNQDWLFSLIKEIIQPNSREIDIGCGTGRFSLIISDKAQTVIGIDLSKRNIEMAKSKLLRNPIEKILFYHTSLKDIISQNLHFNYAVMTYVIHEVDEKDRVELLKQLSLISDKIIIGDYLLPKPNVIWSTLNEVVEYFAGKEHYSNYKNFIQTGGLTKLVDKAELEIIKEIKNKLLISHLVVLQNKALWNELLLYPY